MFKGALTLGHLAVAVFTPNRAQICQCVSVASLARPGDLATWELGEVCCYGTGRYGTDANEPTRTCAHGRLRNLSWMMYSPCDDQGHNKGDERSFPLNGKHISK